MQAKIAKPVGEFSNVSLKISWTVKTFRPKYSEKILNLNNYFNFHVCLSMVLSRARILAPFPAVTKCH